MSLLIKNVTQKFKNTQALSQINLEIQESEFIAILGPSGCGKTTRLRLIGGFLEPTEGEIYMGDQLYSGRGAMVPVEERDLGMVFQSFALWPHMTVRQHVEFPMKSKRQKNLTSQEKEEAVNNALECTGMTFYQNRLPGELSGGQRQRVALARAIVGKPSILLMDEPLSALDAELKIEMRKEIQDIHKITGATIIYVTHDQSEALAMADRIIIMKDGHIEQVGTPKEIYMEPKTSFAATFVSKCNLLEGSWMGSRFKVAGEDLFFEKENVAQAFLTQGVYPIRPEQFHMEKEGLGLKAVVTNKQYNGREIHYTVNYKNQLFTVYAGAGEEYEPGEEVRLILSA